MGTITSEQDVTVQQGGGGAAAPAPDAANPFAMFKTEVSTGETERLAAVEAAKDPAAAAAKVAEAAAAATAAAASNENVIEGPEAEAAAAAEAEAAAATTPEKGGKSKFQQRLDQFRRQTSDAEARAERAEAALAEERRTKKVAPTPSTTEAKSWKTDPTAPKPDNFPFGEVDPDFIVALADWRFEQRTAQQAEVDKTNSARSAAEAEASKVNAEWEARAEAAAVKLPDFVDVVYATTADGKPAWPASALMSRLIKASPQGPEVAYHLAKNPAEARRIFALPVEQQAVEFGSLKTKFATGTKAPAKVPGAPPPPKVVATGQGGTPPSASSSSDFAAFEAQVKAQNAAKTARR